MKPSFGFSSVRNRPARAHRNRGAVLVVVLAFVALFAGLILAFLKRTMAERQIADSSSNQTQVNLLARGAMGKIIEGMREEIMSPLASTHVQKGDRDFYVPLCSTNMVMARTAWTSGAPDPIPNLIRKSLFQDTLPVSTKASDCSSSTPSYGRPGLSLSFWNRHYLVPRQNTNAAFEDTTPISAFTAPDWVMVGNAGPKVISKPDSEIIGRYAYAIYNAGGVLDANVAGHPRGMSVEDIGQKGGVALADLTILGLTAQQVDNLMGWRNHATLEPAAGQSLKTGYDFSDNAPAAARYLDYLKTLVHGFRIVNSKVYQGETDRVFNDRRELIRFWKSNGMSPNSLQYFGILGAGLEVPSWIPDASRPKNKNTPPRNETTGTYLGYGGNDAYDPTGILQDRINPSLLSEINSGGKTAIKSRFPLNRLSLLKLPPGTNGPDSANVADIKKYFGLTWDSTNAYWVYDHGNPNAIYKLSEIPEDREPDFFELLKAAIHCDSLGKQHGGNGNPGGGFGTGSPHMFTRNNAALDSSVNYQIMVIGANIIDQYDADSYPTRILFDSSSGASFPRIFCGVENIPHLYGWRSSWYRIRQLTASDISPSYQPPPAASGKNGFPYETRVLMQPILWNPHRPPLSSEDTSLAPNSFKVVASGMTSPVAMAIRPVVKCGWWPGITLPSNNKLAAISSYPAVDGFTNSNFSDATVSPSTSWITFDTATTGKAAFREPYRLQSPNYPSGSNANASKVIDTVGAAEVGDPNQNDTLNATAIGIDVGACWTGPCAVTSPVAGSADSGVTARCLSTGWLSASLRLELQYKNPYSSGPDFLSFDVISEVGAGLNRESTIDADDTVNKHRATRAGFRADPRTNRWEPGSVNTLSFWDAGAGVTPASGANTIPSDANGPYYYYPQGMTLYPGAGSLTLRQSGNANGGIPQAPGWYVSGRQAYGDLMLNYFQPQSQSAATPGNKLYYDDPDLVLRRASGAFYSGDAGLAMSNVSASTLASGSPGAATGNYNSRPIVLNRPFRSVAELGYAFRGTPWKNLDFFTPESGDSALLDVFCLNEVSLEEDDFRVNGRLDLNTRQSLVLKSLLVGTSKAEGEFLSENEANAVANQLVSWTSDYTTAGSKGILLKGPLRNRGELVGKWIDIQKYAGGPSYNTPNTQDSNIDGAKSYSGFSSLLNGGSSGVFASGTDGAIQRRRESVMRALVDSGETRVWNVMIDLVAQTGSYPKATLNSGTLQDFRVTGEVHYWIHLSVDRLTGDVLQQRMEVVSN